MDWLTPALVGVIGSAVISGAVTYLVAHRVNSGSISTSDAASLWEESNNLRREYREKAESLEKQLKTVNARLQEVMDELNKVRTDSASANAGLLDKIAELKGIINKLRRENKRLLKALNKENAS